MPRKKKYTSEEREALNAIQSGNLPYRLYSDKGIRGVMTALWRMLRMLNIFDIGVSSDPDKDSVWLRKYDD